ncbi:MAG: sulfatase [Cytophagales bacterium]|nr:sulfatase [Cytophagales bacterium]
MRRIKGFFLIAVSVSFLTFCNPVVKEQRPNILFIAVDDLRPELGCYGKDYIHSPNLDRLTEEGFVFKKHYVTVPTCGASRHSMLTGRLPGSKADIKNSASSVALSGKPEGQLPETFIHYLRRNGYYTVGIGKITHHPDGYVYGYTDPVSDVLELPHSWDEMLLNVDRWGTGHNAFFGYADGSNRNTLKGRVRPYEFAEVDDEGYPDGLIAKTAIEKLRQLKERKQPFFIGAGFFKPHLPFNAPKKYWDLYDRDLIPLSSNPDLPQNVHRNSLQRMGEFNNYKLGEEKASLDYSLSEQYAKKLGHGYAACISYIDAQIGKILRELNKLELDKNTVVVVWGDHGWHLGDHRIWGKHTLLERSVHSTLILKVPGEEGGSSIEKIVSSIDIYPTLMELAQLNMPYETKGRSLLPLMQNPGESSWKEAAYSYFKTGISVRVPEYRMNKYFREEQPDVELFDHRSDPLETKNVAPENPSVIESIMPVWEAGNTGLFAK